MVPVPNPLAESCNTVGCPFVESLKTKFQGVFSGVGRLKNYQLKLHIDPQVTPVVQKMRRIPFSLKDKVTVKVNELLENDIIERVERPTTWITPVVIAPKLSGDIRLCVDMRRANEAIVRERLPIPTVDEVLESLNGSTVFSKLDLRWGFHQIELEPNSRDISDFKIHYGDALVREKCERLLPVTSLVVVQASFPAIGRLSGTANTPS